MASLSGNRHVTNALIAVAAALIFYVVFLQFYFDKRSELVVERDARTRALSDAHNTLQEAARLRKFQQAAGATLKADSTEVETRLLHLVHDWDQQTGVSDASFARVTSAQEHGFTRLTFQMTGSGAIGAVAGLLYHVETSPIPLRVDSAVLSPKGATDNLLIRLDVSALCRGIPSKTPPAPSAGSPPASTDDLEGRL